MERRWTLSVVAVASQAPAVTPTHWRMGHHSQLPGPPAAFLSAPAERCSWGPCRQGAPGIGRWESLPAGTRWAAAAALAEAALVGGSNISAESPSQGEGAGGGALVTKSPIQALPPTKNQMCIAFYSGITVVSPTRCCLGILVAREFGEALAVPHPLCKKVDFGGGTFGQSGTPHLEKLLAL
jgi:hypothetical protein